MFCNLGKGAVYSFDPVGSYQRDTYKAGGSASAMLQPLLDNQVHDTHCILICCCHNTCTMFVSSHDAVFRHSVFTADGVHSCLSLLPQIGFKNMEGVQHVPLTKDKAVQLVKDVFISAAERDVYTGDALRICVITKEGINEQTIALRKD